MACAVPLRGGEERCLSTGGEGRAIFAVAPGTYHVRAEPPASTRLGPAVATAVTVAGDTEKDLALPRRARITGTIKDDGGTAVAGGRVCASAAGLEVGCAKSDAKGAYELLAPPDAYKLEVSGPPGGRLVPLWFDARVDSERADLVDVRGRDAAGVDATLVRGLVLSGTVRAAAGKPLAKAQVCTRSLAEPLPFDCDRTDETGGYRALRAPGQHYVWVVPPDDEPLLPQWYERALTGVASKPVELGADTRVDFALDGGPAIRGRLTTTDGMPVGGAHVCADTPFASGKICRPTDANGRYSITTRPETYVVDVRPPDGSDLIASYWSGRRSWVDADEVVVGRADVTLDLVVRRGVVLRGLIRDATGVPLEGASVNLNDAAGVAAAASAGPDGRYTLAVAPGTYTVDVFAPGFGGLLSLVGMPLSIVGPTVYDATLRPAAP